jgi:hypothetical protein
MSLRWILYGATFGFTRFDGRVILVHRALRPLMIWRFKRCVGHGSSSGRHSSSTGGDVIVQPADLAAMPPSLSSMAVRASAPREDHPKTAHQLHIEGTMASAGEGDESFILMDMQPDVPETGILVYDVPNGKAKGWFARSA